MKFFLRLLFTTVPTTIHNNYVMFVSQINNKENLLETLNILFKFLFFSKTIYEKFTPSLTNRLCKKQNSNVKV
jgi:hypothetical protein